MNTDTFSLTLNFKREDDTDIGILVFEGNITIENAQKIKTLLLDMIEKTDVCHIEVQKITQIDLAGIQLLFSAKKYADEYKKIFKLVSDCPLHFMKVAKISGFDNINWLY
ncbi:STAS domain-containing protein [bacterium]|nr:STAS domain-containing protein [bacterium]